MSTPEQQLQSMIDNFPANTGRSLDAWVEAVRAEGLGTHGAMVGWLKSTHGMGHGYANLVAQTARNGGSIPGGEPDLVEAQYAGKKAHLRPILDAVLAAVEPFGEVEIAPKKTSVSLRRTKQFALVQPSTATRVDVCIQLKGEPVTPRLQKAKSSMTTHQVAVTSADDVDAELIAWLRAAWERAG